jgi:peptide/nickel transport system substrate-binding protein
MRATGDYGTIPDPYTGLVWPQRIESAAITVEEGLPVGKTLDWLTLDFAPEIQVPGDAWVDWDAVNQVFVTADEKLAMMSAMPAMETDPGTIVDVAVADGRFTTLVAAVTAADLVGTLSGEGPFTVFAPTDDAFAALPEGTLDALLADIPALTDILLYHVVAGYAPASKVVELDAATTVLGKNVAITIDEEGNVFVNDSQVIITDVMANNGVIHVIDAVLLPPEGDAEANPIVLVPEYFTAKRKSVVTYPADLFEKHTWHDGSPITPADFVMGMILSFDPGTEGSVIFDESQVGAVESFKSAFKGMKVASTDPLVIEYYSDVWHLDAEYSVADFWPYYAYGEGPWHMIAIGILAETDGELAFSADKSEALEVEWTNYISGPSLDVLRANLDQAVEEDFVPYAATLGQFITAEEAAERYGNLLDWYRIQGHFFVNSGPFYLNKVFPVEKTLTLTRYQDYQDPSGKWDRFGMPQIAEVEVDGPGRVTAGEEVVFDAFITFEGEPYPSADLKEVNYLLFDATGVLVEKGLAEMVEEGLYSVTLSAEATGALAAGANKLEVIAVPTVVSVPTFAQFEFVTE